MRMPPRTRTSGTCFGRGSAHRSASDFSSPLIRSELKAGRSTVGLATCRRAYVAAGFRSGPDPGAATLAGDGEALEGGTAHHGPVLGRADAVSLDPPAAQMA